MPGDLQEIKIKLEEAEAELERVRTLKRDLGKNLGPETFQKLEKSVAKAKAEFEKRQAEFIGANVSQYLLEQTAKLENQLPEVNLRNWQKALVAFDGLKNIDLPCEEQVLEAVKKRLLARVLKDLPKQQQEELGRLLEQEDGALITQFLRENKPEFRLWVVEEVERMKKEIMELIG